MSESREVHVQRLLLSCKSVDDAKFLKSHIEAKLLCRVMVAGNHAMIEQAAKERSVQMLLLQTGNPAAHDLAYAQSLRQMGYPFPIMMITDSLGTLDLEAANTKHKVYFLERPFDLKTLFGLTRKLLLTRVVPPQIGRRYPTKLHATLESFASNDKYDAQMFNISRGGAYFESRRKPAVAIGDLIRLRVHLADMDRDHYVHGRVVWTTHKGPVIGGFGVGLKFLKSSDIYRNLLDRV